MYQLKRLLHGKQQRTIQSVLESCQKRCQFKNRKLLGLKINNGNIEGVTQYILLAVSLRKAYLQETQIIQIWYYDLQVSSIIVSKEALPKQGTGLTYNRNQH